VELLRSEGSHIVCHLKFVRSVRPSEAAFDVNVTGTMKVLDACAQAGVKKVVLKSSTAVYGACSNNPAFLTEEHSLRGRRRYGYNKDREEIETFCSSFRRQAPETALTILRFPGIAGPTADTPMTRFLKNAWVPVLLGFDPMMQIIHEDDVIETLAHAVINDMPGVFNVAAAGVLPLRRLVSLCGKLPLPVAHPLAYRGLGPLGSRLRLDRYFPIEPDYLRYPWVGDLTKMREELGFMPRYTAEETLRQFAGTQRGYHSESEQAILAYDEERLRATIKRRGRAREQGATMPLTEEM
jgi:UDP-glucose 4-epimerase